MTIMPFGLPWLYLGEAFNFGRTMLVFLSKWRVHLEGGAWLFDGTAE